METIRENTAKYIILTMVAIAITFFLDHYLLGGEMSVPFGLALTCLPVIFMIVKDVIMAAGHSRH